MINLREHALRVHAANAKWWVDLETGLPITRNVGELLMLAVSELAEAMEGHRKNLQDDKLPHRKMFEVELADALIRLLDDAGGLALPIRETPRGVIILSENVAESLLKINIVLMRAYHDRSVPELFSLWIETAILGLDKLATQQGLDLYGAYEEKMIYNASRHDHTLEGRKAADGKKY